jgi:UDP-2,3-diacylglucosamine pyrophosphatase LpxH
MILVGDILDLWICPANIMRTMEPYKSAFNELVKTSREVETIYVYGNHDYMVKRLVRDMPMTIVADYRLDNMFFIHGWQFDAEIAFLNLFSLIPDAYYYIVSLLPRIYQEFWRHPGDIPKTEAAYSEKSEKIHRVAVEFRKRLKCGYLVMGHTHDPGVYDAVVDCGDMIDSLSYIVIEDGVPEIRRLER